MQTLSWGKVVKNGSWNGVQRFICCECNRTFTDQLPRYSDDIKLQAIDMHLNGCGIRKTARFLKIAPATVINWLRAFRDRCADQLERAAQTMRSEIDSDIIELDEIYTFCKKNETESLYGLLILEGKVALLRM
ncbi:MAG: IS1-like element transposase [Candidatus Caenarcaniphilales bacterium]|nr:IS1-like element transposase [Candidatus Caenarcaniphilales bacterium]